MEKLCNYLQWPLQKPRTPGQLVVYENVHETLGLYLWLGMRFPEHFVARDEAREMQVEIEDVIGHYIVSKFQHCHSSGRYSEEMVEMAEDLLKKAMDDRRVGHFGQPLVR